MYSSYIIIPCLKDVESQDIYLEPEDLPPLGPVLQLHYLVGVSNADSTIC